MGRTSKTGASSSTAVKDAEKKKAERSARMAKFNLVYARPAKMEKDMRRAMSKERRVGTGAPEHLCALLETFGDLLLPRLLKEAGEGHHIQPLHIAKAFADPKSGFYGAFPTQVAGVYLPPDRTEPKQKPKKSKKSGKKNKEENEEEKEAE